MNYFICQNKSVFKLGCNPSIKYSSKRIQHYGCVSTKIIEDVNNSYSKNKALNLGNHWVYSKIYSHGPVIIPSRAIRQSCRLLDQSSSKVEETVKSIKNKQKEQEEELKREYSQIKTTFPEIPKPVVLKKSLKDRIWDEVLHYYHGFRLLFIDINICRKLLGRVLRGKTLTRRENRLLVRTTSDVFRLIPFSVFIIVPFMEILLPVFIKFFPGMLPSTFQTAKDREDRLKQSFQVRLEMAKFLQKALDEMAVQHKDHNSQEAKDFAEFFRKIKDPSEFVKNDEIIKFSKRFEDEITLDSLNRNQLVALCRVLELNTVGTTNFLRFQLRLKLRSLAADDRVISREGVSALDLFELQQACKTRGMRAYGLSAEKLRSQLQEWIDLSMNEKVPNTLLLLSRALMIAEEAPTTHKLKETIRVLPDVLGAQTKAAIGEREGKIDNKVKIEIIKEEERMIKEERDEEREDEKQKAKLLMDKVPFFDKQTKSPAGNRQPEESTNKMMDETHISPKDAELLSEALKSVIGANEKLLVEKETIKDLKEEIADYKEDLEELHEITTTEVREPVKESRGAKILFKKVNAMIGQLDKLLSDIEEKSKGIHAKNHDQFTGKSTASEGLVSVDELINALKQILTTPDEAKLLTIEKVLSKIDADRDGTISANEVLKVVETIGKENVKLSEKMIEELLDLLDKEQIIEAEVKVEKAIAKSIKEADNAMKVAEEIQDLAPILKDTATDLNISDQKNNIDKFTKSSESDDDGGPHTMTSEKQKEKILPKSPPSISSTLPPTIPPPPNASQGNPKDKML